MYYLFEMDDKCKIIKNKTSVIKETCCWLLPFHKQINSSPIHST